MTPAQATPGDLDPLFSGDGKTTTDFGKEEFGSGVALQADGKFLVAGTSFHTVCEDIWCSSPAEFALARYNADGTLDTSFSEDGRETTDFRGADYGAHDVAIQPDDKIVAVGHTGNGADEFAIARYNPNGALDTSFSGDGMDTTDFGALDYGTDFGAYDVAIQPDLKIVAVGRTGAGDFGLVRYNADGSLDPSFSGDGKETSDLGGWDYGRAVALQADGKIVVAGTTLVGADGDFAIARYNPNGTLDSSFSGDGKETPDFGVRHDGEAVTLQADGKIVVAGSSQSDDGNFALTRHKTDGSLDTSFSGNGEQTTNFGGRDFGHAVAIRPDGEILVAGESAVDFALAVYKPDGSLDSAFSADGKQTTDFGAGFGSLDIANDVAIQPDGKIVAAGRSDNGFALARYEGGSALSTAPTNSSRPTISGTATEGQTLTVNPGAWTGSTPINQGYQWRRCDSAGANCVDIAAATAPTYTVTAADVGHTMRVRETATNAHGARSVDSAATAVVKARAGAIAGIVRSASTSAAISGASVNCGTGYSATTASNGAYSIANVTPRSYSYSCTASAKRHRPLTRSVTVASGQKVTASFSLARS